MAVDPGPGPAGRFQNLSIRSKIFTLIALMTGVSVLVCTLALVQLGKLQDDLSELGNQNTARLVALARLQGTQAQLNGGVAGFTAAGVRAAFRQSSLSVLRDSAAQQDGQIEAFGAIRDEDIQASFPRLRTTWRTLYSGLRVFVLREQPLAGSTVPKDGEELATLTASLSQQLARLTSGEQAEARAAAEAGHQTYRHSVLLVVLTLIVSLLVVLALTAAVVSSLVRPIRQVSAALDALANGDLRAPVQVFGKSETGMMASSLRRAQEALGAAMSVITTSSEALTGNSQQLNTVSNEVARNAEQTSGRSTEAAMAAEEVSRNVETVAAATEQMGASIREISSSSTDALRVAAAAVDEATKATRTVAKLGDSSAQIGNVIKTITSIAEQTNLLALNATIEAARAGEAGKGFAVVASEVKELAQETARATDDISGRVEAIQLDVEAAVEVIARISQIIEDVNAFQTTIASAVEEQSATSEQIARNVVGAAAGSRSIATNIEEVAGAARASSAGIEHARHTSQELESLAGQLRQVVAQFTV